MKKEIKVYYLWKRDNHGFVVKVNEKDLEKARELAWKGFGMWNDVVAHPEYKGVDCYVPSTILLDRAGIEYEIEDLVWEE